MRAAGPPATARPGERRAVPSHPVGRVPFDDFPCAGAVSLDRVMNDGPDPSWGIRLFVRCLELPDPLGDPFGVGYVGPNGLNRPVDLDLDGYFDARLQLRPVWRDAPDLPRFPVSGSGRRGRWLCQ